MSFSSTYNSGVFIPDKGIAKYGIGSLIQPTILNNAGFPNEFISAFNTANNKLVLPRGTWLISGNVNVQSQQPITASEIQCTYTGSNVNIQSYILNFKNSQTQSLPISFIITSVGPSPAFASNPIQNAIVSTIDISVKITHVGNLGEIIVNGSFINCVRLA